VVVVARLLRMFATRLKYNNTMCAGAKLYGTSDQRANVLWPTQKWLETRLPGTHHAAKTEKNVYKARKAKNSGPQEKENETVRHPQ